MKMRSGSTYDLAQKLENKLDHIDVKSIAKKVKHLTTLSAARKVAASPHVASVTPTAAS